MRGILTSLGRLSTIAPMRVDEWIQNRLLYPSGPCVLCDTWSATGTFLCESCLGYLPFNFSCCTRCALPLPETMAVCGSCITTACAWGQVLAPFQYQEPVASLIWQLKYRQKLYIAKTLGLIFAEYCRSRAMLPELVIPVPLHPKRLRQRGYNQAQELARVIASVLQLPIDSHSCQRIRQTQDQARLDARARQRNMRNAFAINRAMTCRHVALVDDVMTTGSTMHELTRCLRDAGVEQVDIWVMARAARQS